MTDDKIREITENHEHAIARIDAYESVQRGNKRWLFTAILTALGAGGGSGVLAYSDNAGDDNVKTVVAVHVATDIMWKDDAGGDIEQLLSEVQLLREAIIRLQSAGNNRKTKAGREDIEDLLSHVRREGGRRKSKSMSPAAADVQQYKMELFGD